MMGMVGGVYYPHMVGGVYYPHMVGGHPTRTWWEVTLPAHGGGVLPAHGGGVLPAHG